MTSSPTSIFWQKKKKRRRLFSTSTFTRTSSVFFFERCRLNWKRWVFYSIWIIFILGLYWHFQLVEFLHHGNTQIRQIGKLNILQSSSIYWPISLWESCWFLLCRTESIQTPTITSRSRFETPRSRLYRASIHCHCHCPAHLESIILIPLDCHSLLRRMP